MKRLNVFVETITFIIYLVEDNCVRLMRVFDLCDILQDLCVSNNKEFTQTYCFCYSWHSVISRFLSRIIFFFFFFHRILYGQSKKATDKADKADLKRFNNSGHRYRRNIDDFPYDNFSVHSH